MKKINEENFDSVIEKEIILALESFYSIYGVIKAYFNNGLELNEDTLKLFHSTMLSEIRLYEETRKKECGYFSFKLPIKKIDKTGSAAVNVESIDEMKSLIKSYLQNSDLINSFIFSQQNVPHDFEKVK